MKGQASATIGDVLRNKKLIASGCVFFTTPQGEPYRSNRPACSNKQVIGSLSSDGVSAVINNGQHGWLCAEHRKMLEAHLESQRKQAVAHIGTSGYSDDDVIDSIITTEKRAIARGHIKRIAFGSFAFKPDFIHYWSKE